MFTSNGCLDVEDHIRKYDHTTLCLHWTGLSVIKASSVGNPIGIDS